MEEAFLSAKSKIEALTIRPQNDELLMLYGLYKQATEGDVSGEAPGGFDFKAAAKYNSWAKQKGKSKEEAMKEYIAFSNGLLEKYG